MRAIFESCQILLGDWTNDVWFLGRLTKFDQDHTVKFDAYIWMKLDIMDGYTKNVDVNYGWPLPYQTLSFLIWKKIDPIKTKCIYGWPFTIQNSKLSRSEEHGSHQPSFSCCRAHKTKYNVICTMLKIFHSIDSKEIIGKLQEEIVKPVKNCM